MQIVDGLLLSGAAVGLAGLWLLKKTGASASNAGAVASVPGSVNPLAMRPPHPGFLPVLEARALFSRTGADVYIAKIRQRLGFTPESYERDIQPLFDAFAQFVQLLPASESHHHAQPGGLLVHLLEVAAYALHFRDAYKLPKGATPEEQTRLAARYSYAVLAGALLHDIGKPVSDVEVILVNEAGEKKPWVPLGGTMAQQGGLWYSVGFSAQRDYRKHEKLGLPLLRALVPGDALAWLGEYRPVMDELLQLMSGEGEGGVLHEVISKADRESVRENLLQGPRTRFASARAVPLIERLMAGLRRLLEEGHVPLNRAGATGFSDGKSLWCVAGTIANAVRDYLNRNETRAAGAAGIPEDNSRLFDTWAEYGALTPNAQAGAIWNVKLTIGAWTQTLTMVRFPLEKLFSDPARYPSALPPGAIETVSPTRQPAAQPTTSIHATDVERAAVQPNDVATQASTAAGSLGQPSGQRGQSGADGTQGVGGHAQCATAERQAQPAARAAPREEAPDMDSISLSEESVSESALDDAFDDPLGDAMPQAVALIESDYICGDRGEAVAGDAAVVSVAVNQPVASRPSTKDGFLDDTDSAASHFGQAALHRAHGDPPDAMKAPVAPKPKEVPAIPQLTGRPGAKVSPHPNVDRFMAWIQEGVRNGTVVYNETQATVHFCAEGMLLVSPRIFREYAQSFEARVELTPEQTADGIDPWRVLQQQFQKSGYPARGPQGTFLWRYNVSGPGGKQLNGNIVPQPERFFDPVPQGNTALKLPPGMPTK